MISNGFPAASRRCAPRARAASSATTFGVEPRTNRRRIWGALLLTLACLSVGCHDYPVIGPGAYELAQAVENLCSRRDPAQLPQARQIVQSKFESGAITADERDWLTSILTTAESGDWESAAAEARRLLESQIDRDRS